MPLALLALRQVKALLECPITEKPLDIADVNPAVLAVTVATLFTPVWADPASNCRKRIGLDQQAPSALARLVFRQPDPLVLREQ
jgi:hypothetical protein